MSNHESLAKVSLEYIKTGFLNLSGLGILFYFLKKPLDFFTN